jgi:flagellar biosynthesis protein
MSRTFDQPHRPELAVALEYDGTNAPRITAKGTKLQAQQILALAEQHNIPLRRDPEMAAILAQVPLGDEVPENLYRAIAEIIAFAYLVSGKRPPGFDRPEPETGHDSEPRTHPEAEVVGELLAPESELPP